VISTGYLLPQWSRTQFVLQQSDVERGLTEGPARTLFSTRAWLVIPLVALFMGMHVFLNPDPDPAYYRQLLPFALMVSAWLGFMMWIRKRTARNSVDGKTEAQRTITFTLDSSGLSIVTPESTAHSKWSTFHSFQEAPSSFLIYVNRAVPQLIPKRAFSDDAIPRVRELLQTHVRLRPKQNAIFKRTLLLWVVLIIAFVAIWHLVKPA
jgi:hypothetical protein